MLQTPVAETACIRGAAQETYREEIKCPVAAQEAKFDAGATRLPQLDAEIDRLRAMRDRQHGMER